MFTSRDLPARRRSLGAFTLVELVLALAILTLLVGALYAIVDATLRGSAELEVKQDRNREMTAFLSLCRKMFAELPATVEFTARVVPDGQRYSSELIFRNAPGFLQWGDAGNAFDATILGVRGQVGGLAGLGIMQDSTGQITSYLNSGANTRPWLMLLSDLRDAQWQFFDPISGTWSKDWTNIAARPAYAELTLTTPDETGTYVFHVSPVAVQLPQ